ncbi:hypothetical protein PUV54_00445 [Hyphococcus flavus]|uniref:Uncharacterized protein n=1 Tax=Hyphococcus flavus TaxID=1866326 RepID=A0AAE9ZDL0_9PROT|nr:hypothetical protein [Hyphococcus flavus]WDI31655.1 hypothetical protein PUV54_00445 [Hyphococcus flavus]
MSNGYGFGGEEIKQESSWRYPLGIFMATLVLCAIFLYYYVGPSVEDFSGNTPSPAITEEPIRVEIGGIVFSPAANYTVYPRARRGGARDEVVLYALWPTMNGYTPAQRKEFIDNDPDTRRIDITISKRSSVFTESQRFERLYLPETIDQRGVRTPYQLTKFNFKDQRSNVPTNGYADTELFVGTDKDEDLAALFCFKELEEISSPECWREFEYGDTIEVSYRFKRPYLPEWRSLDAAVQDFVRKLDQSTLAEE